MLATKQSYAAEEAAGRVIPSVAPLAVDPVSEVRHSALATLDAFVKLLQENSAARDSAAGTEAAPQQVLLEPVQAFKKHSMVCLA